MSHIDDDADQPADDETVTPDPVPGAPGSTDTAVPSPDVEPLTPPDPDSITGSKTAPSSPPEKVRILDSNHAFDKYDNQQ